MIDKAMMIQNEHHKEQENETDDDYLTMPLPDVSSSLLSARQKKVYAQRERGMCKPYRIREHEKREEGLNTSLFDSQAHSKAMEMMFKMGYTKGASLGKGQSKSRLEPLEINIKTDRAGIGHDMEQKHKIKQELKKLENQANYEERVRLERETKHLEARIREAQRICENLDGNDCLDEPRKVNVLWRGLIVERIEKERERRRRHEMLDRIQNVDDLQDDEIKPSRHTRVEWSEDDQDLELDTFNQLDPEVRFVKILNYLRQNYHYCFWCGCAYENTEDLLSLCPGEKEEDH